jgi:hypothetical protein
MGYAGFPTSSIKYQQNIQYNQSQASSGTSIQISNTITSHNISWIRYSYEHIEKHFHLFELSPLVSRITFSLTQ